MTRVEFWSGFRAAFAVAAVFLVAVVLAPAQSQFGSVVGTVTDPSGARVPDATVHATNEASNLGFSTVTGASGEYVIGGLLPGLYTIRAQKTGFQDFRVTSVLVRAGQSARADVSISLGSAAQAVTVSASATPLTTESGTVVAEAPTQFILTPTLVQPTQMLGDLLVPYLPGQNYIGGRAVSAYGSRSYDRRETVDGAVIGNASTSGIRMPRGSVNELESPSLTADAEHQTASTTEMFTAKGTNEVHGSFWSELQNGALNQLPFYALPGTPKHGVPTVGIGFIAGGPVYIPKLYNGRNKTFFHVTLQKYWAPIPYGVAGTGATNAMRSGDFSGLGVTIKDPQTGQPFSNAMIPASRISPIAQSIYNKYFPSITLPYASPDFPIITTTVAPFWDLFARVDEQFGPNDLLSVTYLHNNSSSLSVPGATSGANTSGPPTTGLATATSHLNFFNISENHIFSPSVLNEVNVGLRLGITSLTTSSNDGDTLTTSLGLPLTPGAPAGIKGGPIINITAMSGLSFGGQSSSDARIYTVRDNLAWTRGRSTTKLGFELIRPTSTSISYANVFGTYGFSGLFTGNPFADFLLGLPSSTSRALPPGPLGVEQQQIGFYATEAFRLTKKMTLNVGFRVEYDFVPIEPHGKYYNFDLVTGNVVVPDQNSMSLLNPGLSPAILSHIVTAASARFPSRLVNGLWNLNPRLGLAYQLASNTVVRAGFGMYGPLLAPGAPTGGPFTPGVQNFTNSNICDAGSCTPAFTLANPFPSSAVQAVSGLSITGTSPQLRTPQTIQWNLTVEHRLPASILLRATYAGSESAQLPYRRNVNLLPASTIPFSTSRLPYPQWFSITYADSGGTSSFSTLDVEFKRRWANGLTFDAGYSWSKCLSDDDESGMVFYGGVGPLGATIENPYDLRRNRGNCEQIARHFFRTTFVLDLPFGTGRHWLSNIPGFGGGVVNAVLGGWTISGMYLARTGHYYTPYYTGVDAANTGQTLIRPDRICGGHASPQTEDHTFDPACFVPPPAGRYGNAGMGILDGLGAWQFDSGIYKYFPLGRSERLPKLRVSMTSINTLGHPAKEQDDISAFIINAPASVARANDCIYTNGATANLGEWRHIYFEARLEW